MISVKCFVRLLFLSVIAAAGWSEQSSTTVRPGSIRWYAQKAKQQGETSITIQAPRGMYEHVTSLDQALSIYYVVIGTPIASLTQLVDSDHVYTWYKVRIIENLITHPNPEVPAVSLPESLSAVTSNEVIIRVPGGALTVDDIRVTVIDREFTLLTLNQKYLLFLSPDSSGKFAHLRSGENSIFIVKSDDKVEPLVARQTPMQEDLNSSTGGSLDPIRAFAKTKASDRLPNN